MSLVPGSGDSCKAKPSDNMLITKKNRTSLTGTSADVGPGGKITARDLPAQSTVVADRLDDGFVFKGILSAGFEGTQDFDEALF